MDMQGSISNSEFTSRYGKHQGHAVIKYGKATWNYYIQHEDGSWTNYDTRTEMSLLTTKFINKPDDD